MTLWEDDRAVSTVIGAVLLFGFLIIMLTIYQSTVVPAENQHVEFDHSVVVQNDMLELRNAILRSDAQGRTTYATVTLGTRYPDRLFAVNPPPPTGTLRTEPPRPISVVDENDTPVTGLCPSSDPIQTRTLSYTPGYNEYDSHPTIVYENTVLYLNYSGKVIPLTGQHLVDGSTVNVNPLNTSFSENGIRAITVEPQPGLAKSRDVPGANVTYPTHLSEDTWESLLAGDVDPGNVTVQNGNLTIHTGGDLTVACSPIGLNQPPPGGARSASAVNINPAGPNDVEVRRFNRPSNDVVEVTFNNTGNRDANVTEARVSFYNNPTDTGGDIGPIDMINPAGTTVLQMPILGSKRPVQPELNFPGNDTETTITFRNPGGEKFSQDDFFVVQFSYSNGKTGTYFVDVPA